MNNLSPSQFLQLPPIRRLLETIRDNTTYMRKDARIIFVCGANSTDDWRSNREELLNYVNKHLTSFKFFRAEEVFEALGGASSTDLLTIEDELGSFSDCIIIVCESQSAFAELGAFAMSEDLVQNLLIINNREFESSDSFINLGPIQKADRKSSFGPAIYADYDAITRAIPELEERVLRIPHSRRSRLDIQGVDFSSLEAKIRLLLMADIINLLSPISMKELVALLKAISGSNHIHLKTELALGVSLGFFSQHTSNGNHLYFHHSNESSYFLSFTGLNPIALRAEVIRVYRQRDKQRLANLAQQVISYI